MHAEERVPAPTLRVPEAGHLAVSAGPLWLALAEPGGPVDLAGLCPDAALELTADAASFGAALERDHPSVVILVAPPARLAELRQVAAWRARHPEAAAMLLSERPAVAARLEALELGFDDAIDLASDAIEIAGRLAIAARNRAGGGAGRRLPVGDDAELDPRARAVWRAGRPLALRPKEYELLAFLAAHPGQAFGRDELVRYVWAGSGGTERVVDVYIYFLRAKLEADPANPVHLVTVRGAGYRLDPPAVARRGGGPAVIER